MSRVGKQPVSVAKGINVLLDGTCIIVTKGKLEKRLETHGRVNITIDGASVSFGNIGEDKQSRAYWGTYRSLFNNIIVGLDQGYSKTLEINGVGYRAAVNGKNLTLQLGFSHPVEYPIPEGLEISVDKNVILVKGADKQAVGQAAAEIREFRPPEPYKGKGVKYSTETILRKAGKSSKK